jgi:hypothetical protein
MRTSETVRARPIRRGPKTGTHAALEGWLADTEALLAEQRQQSISPTLYSSGYGERHETTIKIAAFAAGLAGLLSRLSRDPGRWILSTKDTENLNHYLQFLTFEDGSMIAECVSNTCLQGSDCWTKAQEQALVELGWNEPEEGISPNWWLICPTTAPDVQGVAR